MWALPVGSALLGCSAVWRAGTAEGDACAETWGGGDSCAETWERAVLQGELSCEAPGFWHVLGAAGVTGDQALGVLGSFLLRSRWRLLKRGES